MSLSHLSVIFSLRLSKLFLSVLLPMETGVGDSVKAILEGLLGGDVAIIKIARDVDEPGEAINVNCIG